MPAHVVQRRNNHQAIFFDDNDYRVYLGWSLQAAKRYDCMIHAYVLMTNHVHILLTPATQHAISAMMQYLGRHYVPYINRVYHRSGTLWEASIKHWETRMNNAGKSTETWSHRTSTPSPLTLFGHPCKPEV